MESLLLRILPLGKYPVFLRYGVTTFMVGIVALIQIGLGATLDGYPLLLPIPVVFLAALIFDRGSGYWGTLLSAVVAVYFFLEPTNSFVLREDQVVPLMLFGAICIIITTLTEALRKTLEKVVDGQKQVSLLMSEMGHRAKNNLQMVSAILSLQRRGQADPAAKDAFADAIARIQVIAKAHDQLQQQGPLVQMKDYLADLGHALGDTMRDLRPIAVHVEAEAVDLDPSVAVPIGLIANELVVNAFKYAFPDDRGGSISIRFRVLGSDEAELVVEDDGVGHDGGREPAPHIPGERNGMGARLTRLLVSQLSGRISYEAASPGTRVVARVRTKRE
jgi:two-component sensor histidine kinase